jgi:hypothetical protein
MQETNLYTIMVPPMIKALTQLSHMLDKAKAHAETRSSERLPVEKQMTALFESRLVFDQFPLMRQIQITCDNAKGSIGRIAEIEVPTFEDTETTYEAIKERIDKTITLLKKISPEQIIGKEALHVTLPYFPDAYFTAFEYVTEYLIPNFFFHYTTAYAILRKNGVELGKSDFMGPLPLQKT